MQNHNIGGGDYMNYENKIDNLEEQKDARRILRNKFNFSEVGLQSRQKIIRTRGVSTSKPLLKNLAGEVN